MVLVALIKKIFLIDVWLGETVWMPLTTFHCALCFSVRVKQAYRPTKQEAINLTDRLFGHLTLLLLFVWQTLVSLSDTTSCCLLGSSIFSHWREKNAEGPVEIMPFFRGWKPEGRKLFVKRSSSSTHRWAQLSLFSWRPWTSWGSWSSWSPLRRRGGIIHHGLEKWSSVGPIFLLSQEF